MSTFKQERVVEFYVHTADNEDVIWFRRSCKSPNRTNEYKRIMSALSHPSVKHVGWRVLNHRAYDAQLYKQVDMTTCDGLPF